MLFNGTSKNPNNNLITKLAKKSQRSQNIDSYFFASFAKNFSVLYSFKKYNF